MAYKAKLFVESEKHEKHIEAWFGKEWKCDAALHS
jgi:hypothetical protein